MRGITCGMNIVEVNFADIVGHIFNGYDLHRALMRKGINANQIVLDKRSGSDSVKALSKDLILHHQIYEYEKANSISNLLYPYGEEIINSKEFLGADIVHYHILHNGMVSLLDYPRLMNARKSVWTIHDPWVVTGNCVHPLTCSGWRDGCRRCKRLDDNYFSMREDNAAFMWEVKKNVLNQVNPDIVVSNDFMKRYIQESPITAHFSKIHKIPFGVDVDKYELQKKEQCRKRLGIAQDKFVVAFRCENADVKGCRYIYDALRKIGRDEEIVLLCVGEGTVPEDIRGNFRLLSFGWVDDEEQMIELLLASDLFLMPSLAESFGLMAVEAMAAGCAVLCFEKTVLEEITNAPYCGIAVKYESGEEIAKVTVGLKNNRRAVEERGGQGRKHVEKMYRFDEYVNAHVRLYESILAE